MTLYPIAQSADSTIIELRAKMANRHGLIAGATGTGKTVTLRKMAESFSENGVPVFLVDVKGDLSGLINPGAASGKVQERIEEFQLGPDYLAGFPVRFWDVFGTTGIPVRVTMASMGPMLLSRLLNLNDTQEGLLNLVFKVAEDQNMAIDDLKDLRALLQNVASKAAEYRSSYGNVSAASVGAIQRSLLTLENEGGAHLFGKPALDLNDWMQTDGDKGVINVLNAEKLMQSPRLFSAFLLWMLTELFNQMPEVGDLEKPKFVMFFDEAHLLFDNASSALVGKVEQVVRLIRSKGVGVYFCTQNPLDLPDSILGQLGNRVQHALRAFTPRDQKAVKAAADTFRPNPKFKVADTISELGVGEALLSFLDEKGMPTPVERAFVYPPRSQLAPISTADRDATYQQDILYRHYKDEIDDESAFERIAQAQAVIDAQVAVDAEAKASTKTATTKQEPNMLDALVKGATGQRKRANGGLVNDVAHQMGNTVYKSIAKQISVVLKNVLSSVLGGKK
ncbi:MAG: DUF853 family protein [Neisseriaceae bacterium]|nr:DUF853 family protein [Neisseriaceae bacterium]